MEINVNVGVEDIKNLIRRSDCELLETKRVWRENIKPTIKSLSDVQIQTICCMMIEHVAEKYSVQPIEVAKEIFEAVKAVNGK